MTRLWLKWVVNKDMTLWKGREYSMKSMKRNNGDKKDGYQWVKELECVLYLNRKLQSINRPVIERDKRMERERKRDQIGLESRVGCTLFLFLSHIQSILHDRGEEGVTMLKQVLSSLRYTTHYLLHFSSTKNDWIMPETWWNYEVPTRRKEEGREGLSPPLIFQRRRPLSSLSSHSHRLTTLSLSHTL